MSHLKVPPAPFPVLVCRCLAVILGVFRFRRISIDRTIALWLAVLTCGGPRALWAGSQPEPDRQPMSAVASSPGRGVRQPSLSAAGIIAATTGVVKVEDRLLGLGPGYRAAFH